MLQILILLLILLPCLLKDERISFYLMVVLLPFHVIIKGALDKYAGGSEVFSVWKEAIPIILIYKIYAKRHLDFDKVSSLVVVVFLFIVLVFFFLNPLFKTGLPALRNYLFPIILFIAASSSILDIKFFKNVFYCFVIASFFSFLAGILQQFFLNVPISLLKGSIDFIDENGYIQYSTVSFRIMGFERMSGFFTGPNDLGVYCAIVILISVGYLLCIKNGDKRTKGIRLFVMFNLFLSIFCILLSFSRAGWAIALIGIASIFLTTKTGIKIKWIFLGILGCFLTLIIIINIYPKAYKILENSFTGREASAAARGNSFNRGLIMNLQEPYGHGVGSTDYRFDASFFVESAWLNTGYEISLIGLFSLIFLLLYQVVRLMSTPSCFRYNLFSHFAVAIAISSFIAGFVSINIYGTTYIYYWWLLLGLGVNKSFLHYSHVLKKPRNERLITLEPSGFNT